MAPKTVYRIFFNQQGKSYELYARSVGPADIYGFIEVRGLLFGELSSVLHNPAEESLKKEFEGVDRFLVPYHQVGRIDEVEKEGRGKIVTLSGNGDSATAIPPPPVPK